MEYFLNQLCTHFHAVHGSVYWLSVVQCLAQGRPGSGSELFRLNISMWIIILFYELSGRL